ncbi:Ppx/GppA phosphatase family-domain-containing protein [Pilobolus umbonatus]|nr:Ppx/GppA phosphatase family-domain-containing protein [Pilobolus umbonatus]
MESIKAPFGVVDMGSNGIRFGIVSALARHLPIAYEERAPISLLDAQGDDHIIPPDVMEEVIISFLRFKKLCVDAKVDMKNIRVIATEATRIALNSADFIEAIYKSTGLKVTLLSKQEEALISASGIVGSFHEVQGLTMDLGGGSVEVSYVISDINGDLNTVTNENSNVEVASYPVSMPYGAAVLKKRLVACESDKEIRRLHKEIVTELKTAQSNMTLPKSLCHKDGYDVYMSGGGFRCLGYLSMAVKAQDTVFPKRCNKRKQMYPIPIINGYSITGEELRSIGEQYKDKTPTEMMKKLKVFRISKRRAGMIPASCFLVSAILEVFKIRRIYFIKAYASRSQFALTHSEFEAIYSILSRALPDPYLNVNHPLRLYRLLPAAIHLSNLTSHYPKETRAFVSFHMPLASGPLANIPGLDHRERAILSVLLTFKQGGSVPDPLFYSIQSLVGRKGISVCKYIGRLMELVFAVSPLHPGMGLIGSGISFKTIVTEDVIPGNSDDSSSESESEGESDDITIPENEDITQFPSMQLCIILPKGISPLVDAPAVMSVIESLDKKVNNKKFDLDVDRRPLKCPNLFSVEIIRK